MKAILLRSATLLHPKSVFNGKKADVFINNGFIVEISEKIDLQEKNVEVIHAEDMFLSPGFFDLNANFGEPGLETKEDFISGTEAAAAGGFTGLALQPSTQPPVQSRAEVAYVVNSTLDSLVDVYPVGCISRKREGVDLAELYDMYLAGAIAFSDGTKPITDSGLMSRALMYAKGFNGIVFSYPEDKSIAAGGKMNEGIVSTFLGMKGIPALAEEVHISRDLYLAEYNDSPIHFSTISSANSVKLIREARKKGLKVTCDVAAHHLVLTDEFLKGFDSNYKVKPPLRTQKDIEALLEGLKDGTIDAIVSQHTPHEIEFKDVEFEIAAFGIIGLQTVLAACLKAGLTEQELVEKLAVKPREILNLPIPLFEPGEVANFVLFDSRQEWLFNEESNRSKSSNSPFIGSYLKGKVILTGNKSQLFTNS